MVAKGLLALVFLFFTGSVFAEPIRVVVISDLNGSYGSVSYEPRVSKAIDAIIDLKPDLVISTGDMVAGQRRPHLSESEVKAMWDAFHRTVTEPLEAAGIPLAVTPGNHDASAYSGFERERRLYEEAWLEHRPDLSFVNEGDFPFHYAFDLGDVRFASLDATTVGALPDSQREWLRETMQGAGPIRVVFSHLPLWPFAVGRESEIIGDQRLVEVFTESEVDLHLSGHHHAYYPGESEGIAYVGQACLGAGPRALIGTTERSEPGFTILDIDDNGVIEVASVMGPDFTELVDVETLPETIPSDTATLRRLDLSGLQSVRTSPSR